jgi:hypothetical protein
MLLLVSAFTILVAGWSQFQSAFGVLPAQASADVSAHFTVLSDIKEGSGTYFEPYVINSNLVEWKVNISGTDKENILYKVDVHMEHYRSCATVHEWKNLTYQDIQARDGKFEYAAEMSGWYYLRIDIMEDGEYNELKDARTHVFFRVPPVNSYTLPYTPPSNNRKPEPRIEILNEIGGSGSYSDPYVIDSPIVEFRIDGTSDPDGEEDLINGVFLWAIHMDGHHPVYAKEQGTRIASESFLYYSEMKNVIFTWDTRERPSTDGQYTLHLPVIDQHGEKNETKVEFTVSTSCSCSDWVDQGCGSGACSASEMYQTRSCSPSGCGTQSRCIESLICTPAFEKEDINKDGNVDQLDVHLSVEAKLCFQAQPDIILRADVNEDGKIDIKDVQQVINKYLSR